jgi:transposase
MQNSLYPTDLSDEQWNLLPVVLPPRPARRGRGRPPADLRRICNALLYLVRAGCAGRLLPRDFGPWQTVYHYFRRWSRQGCWQTIPDVFRDGVRHQAGKRSQPTAAILDSQTVGPTKRASEARMPPRKPKASNVMSWWTRWGCSWPSVSPKPTCPNDREPAAGWKARWLVFDGYAVCGPTKATAERSWPGGWRGIARPALYGWRSCHASKISVALRYCANAGSSNERSAGL